MSDVDPKVMEAMERFASMVGDDPRVREVLDQVREGKSEAEVMADLARLVESDPELSERIQEAAKSTFRPLREESDEEVQESVAALKRLKDRQRALADLNFDEEDLVFHPEGTALPQMHPVVMGYILERLQFDGDIPELRTGDLPLDAMPAVPVKNPSRDPVTLGYQLEKGAKEVREELDEARRERAGKLNAIGEALEQAEASGTAVAQRKAKSEFVAVSEGRVGVEGYKAGHKAALRKVSTPSGAEIAQMNQELRQKYAHKALTSTQGRASAVPVIGAMVQASLAEKGYQVTLNGPESLMEDSAAEAEWTASIAHVVDSTQPGFAFIDTAAKAMAAMLAKDLGSPVGRILLHVETINEVSRRRVGWRSKVAVAQ